MERLRKGKEEAKASVAASLAYLCLPEGASTLVILQSGPHHPGLEPHPQPSLLGQQYMLWAEQAIGPETQAGQGPA